MEPVPVQSLSGDSTARRLLLVIVRTLAVGGLIMSAGVALLLTEPLLAAALGGGAKVRNVNWQGYGIPAFPYRYNTVYVASAMALLLLLSSAAALVLRPWGRVGMVWYGITSITHILVLLIFPPLYSWYFGLSDSINERPNLFNTIREASVYIAVVVTSMIYPVLVVVVMRHPAVIALFQKVGLGFEPTFAARVPTPDAAWDPQRRESVAPHEAKPASTPQP